MEKLRFKPVDRIWSPGSYTLFQINNGRFFSTGEKRFFKTMQMTQPKDQDIKCPVEATLEPENSRSHPKAQSNLKHIQVLGNHQELWVSDPKLP